MYTRMPKKPLWDRFIETALPLVIASIASALIFVGLYDIFERHERIECLKWESQSTEYANWYATHWQVEQCANYNVDLSDFYNNDAFIQSNINS